MLNRQGRVEKAVGNGRPERWAAVGPEAPETAREISHDFPDIDPAEFFDPEEFGVRKSDQRP